MIKKENYLLTNFFDLEKNTLKIVAFEKNKINANIELE